jgi:hypothetical protein
MQCPCNGLAVDGDGCETGIGVHFLYLQLLFMGSWWYFCFVSEVCFDLFHTSGYI